MSEHLAIAGPSYEAAGPEESDLPAELGRLVASAVEGGLESKSATDPDAQDPDAKLKTRQSRGGKKLSPATRTKMSWAKRGDNNPNYGKTASDETRTKMSRAQRGKKHSAEAKAKISRANKGKNSPFYNQSIDKVRLAIEAHARGETMAQASRDQGFNTNWLGCWKRKYPGRFQAFYQQAIDGSTTARPIQQPASENDDSGNGKPPQEERTREEKIAVLLPHLDPIEYQIMLRHWGLEGHQALSVAEINQQLFQGSPIWEAKVRGTIKAAEMALFDGSAS